MWKGPGQDPGGGGGSDGGPPESDLDMISQLKDAIHKNSNNLNPEKIDEYMETLSKLGARVKQKDTAKKSHDIPAKERVNLLRRQLEENKAKMAERGKSQKGIEEMLSQFKAQLDDSQQLFNQSLNTSLPVSVDKLEYSSQSSREELFNILTVKERTITDLLGKVQKLEANVIDLQDNIKEKDSVLDARTKAITLMTESLSKKSKTSIDALDETREQMRKMQENFVNLEADMKARQLKLLDDLKLKNYEIADLQQENYELKQKLDEQVPENFEEKLKDLQQQLEEKTKENKKLLKELTELSENSEIEKLKKQLDESNKSMIKSKAQHKSKVKELNKIIDQFKKSDEINAEFLKLKSENNKLNQKIAELEEEKGSLQLKLVEFENGNKVDFEKMLEEKEEVISFLEKELRNAKQDIDCLHEKLASLSHLETQVSSAMTSIQFEEQLDNIEKEKQELVDRNRELTEERENLIEEIEILKREKQELNNKLENYVQENMELVDKLEKLSAEKVSSAESIEIVEALTQQEKLELEAYQKSFVKEDVPDLNESVNELNEETKELLQRIELFTVERREVMEKMELLNQNNNQLNLKIKEIENNRDVLAETYEQLQNEKENLDNKLEALLKENEEFKQNLQENDSSNIEHLQKKLEENEKKLENLEELNKTLAELQNENKQLENRIKDIENLNELMCREKNGEIDELVDEKDHLLQLIKEKDEKFHKISQELTEKYLKLQTQLEANSTNIEEIRNNKIEELTNKNKEQLEKMKKLAANLKKKSQSYVELEDKFNGLLNEIREKDEEISNLREQLKQLENENQEKNLQEELLLTSENFSEENNLRNKIQELELIKETLETELSSTKERVSKLEEGISYQIERKASLERLANELGAQLEEKNINFEEVLQSEDALEKKLESLKSHDEAVEKKLREITLENQELSESNKKLTTVNEKLKKKLVITQEKIKESANLELRIHELEEVNEILRKSSEKLEGDFKKLQHIYQELEKDSERLNFEWQQQFDSIMNERNELLITTQKQQEELEELENNYRNKLDASEVEIEKLIKENKNKILEIEDLKQVREELEITKEQLMSALGEFEILQQRYDEIKVELAQRTAEFAVNSIIGEAQNKMTTQNVATNTRVEESTVSTNTSERILSRTTSISTNIQPKLPEVASVSTNTVSTEIASISTNTESVPSALNITPNVPLQVDSVPSVHLSIFGAPEESEEIKTVASYFDTKEDPFAFVSEPISTAETSTIYQQEPPSQVNLQELYNKVKTLEFMLFSVEKEKEEALRQCNKLTDELTRLVYERESINQSLQHLESLSPQNELESQIRQPEDFDLTPQQIIEIQQFSYEKTEPGTTSPTPVQEDVCQTKTAYICGDPEGPKEQQNPLKELESQIRRPEEFELTPQQVREIKQFGYEKVKSPVTSTTPIQEEACKSKTAYICTADEDGWAEESKLEEEHLQQLEQSPIVLNLKEQLEQERLKYQEEIKAYQVKVAKLLKKLKEMKQRKKVDDLSLDETFQEEYKLQIEQIEKKLKETTVELEKEKAEKNSILKRIDVLTAANERMVEMKEKQDVDILTCQRNCRELKEKLEKFEWGNDNFVDKTPTTTTTKIDESKLQELNNTIQDLSVDNEELQALLEEQRTLRIELEKKFNSMQEELINKEAELNQKIISLEEEKKMIENQFKNSNENELEDLRNRVKDLEQLPVLKNKIESLEEERSVLVKEKEELGNKVKYIEEELHKYEEQFKNLQQEKDFYSQNYNDLYNRIAIVENEKQVLENQIVNSNQFLEVEFNENKQQLQNLLQEKEFLMQQNTELSNKIKELDEDKKTFQNQISSNNQFLEIELNESRQQIENLLQENKQLQERVANSKDFQEIELNNKLAILENEKQILNQQLAEQVEKINKLEEKRESLEDLRTKFEIIVKEKVSLEEKVKNLEKTIGELHEQNANLQLSFHQLEKEKFELENGKSDNKDLIEQNRHLENKLKSLVEEWEYKVEQRGNDVAESWKLHLESRENEFNQLESYLRKEINDFEEKYNALVNENNELRKNVDAEIRNEVDRVSALQQQINDRQSIINELNNNLKQKNSELEELQQEYETVKKQLHDNEGIINEIAVKLQINKENILTTISVISDEKSNLRQQLKIAENDARSFKESYENLQVSLQEKNLTISSLNLQLEDVQNLKDYENENTRNLQQNLLEFQQLNASQIGQLQQKDFQIKNLQLELEEKERQISYIQENTEKETSNLNEQIEKLKQFLLEKDENLTQNNCDMEQLKIQLEECWLKLHDFEEKQKEFEEVAKKLAEKSTECLTLEEKLNEQNILLEEENKQLTDYRQIIEDQVLKIEELKNELYQKSKDYDSIIAQMDIAPLQTQRDEENLSEPVSRAELDLALYMLHQRDVRCEELTVELTQLLEERDTLQLRLSNAIREKEELWRIMKEKGVEEAPVPSTSDISTVDVEEKKTNKLATKLSELKTVGYKKDKTIVDEQELRRMQELSVMQQHRDIASKLPPEAAARLVDASYTLSRDVQSPSKVLLNWLWGRSTPKVNDI